MPACMPASLSISTARQSRWSGASSMTPMASCCSCRSRGACCCRTEFGMVEADPGEIAVIPRGVKFRVELPDGRARGYVCENYGELFRLPELGPIGANGLANPRDFLSPAAAFEDRDERFEIVAKFAGNLWATELDHSPLDVVAWHGNYAPVQIRSCPLQHARLDQLRPSRSVDLHGADGALRGARHRKLRLRNLPAALAGGRAYLSPALVPPQRHERVHGTDLWRL